MQECRVCGLLFLGGGACPSCGSQVAVDVETDDIVMDDESIPGLDEIADAMKSAAKDLGIPVRWGAAWHINNIADYDGPLPDAWKEYCDLRRSQGKRPFIDAPHFELM